MWSENDTTELALSFQERAGCDEIWAKICQVSNCDLLSENRFSFLYYVLWRQSDILCIISPMLR